MSKEKNIVKVGSKPKKAYLNAVFYQLDKFDSCVLRGLGRQQSKVMELKLDIESINDIEAKKVESVVIDDTPGLQVLLERGDRR